MALDESALSELLAAFRAGEGIDLVREAVRLVMQELIETEATTVIGACDPGRSIKTMPRNPMATAAIRTGPIGWP